MPELGQTYALNVKEGKGAGRHKFWPTE